MIKCKNIDENFIKYSYLKVYEYQVEYTMMKTKSAKLTVRYFNVAVVYINFNFSLLNNYNTLCVEGYCE